MDVLWAATAPRSVRDVHEALAARDLAYTTVMTVLDRLAKKGLAVREREGRAWLYRAAASREELAAESISESLATLGTDRRAAIVHFLGQADPDELAAVREALAEVERRHGAGADRT